MQAVGIDAAKPDPLDPPISGRRADHGKDGQHFGSDRRPARTALAVDGRLDQCAGALRPDEWHPSG